ncbi:MAG: P-II family nitrogen regulator [Christensenellales bacterium]|jgi:nitrogen regulatory protein PII
MPEYNLIVTIVNKGKADEVMEACRREGVKGGTLLKGRGQGIHEQIKLFGIHIEPEKDILLNIVERDKTESVLKAINAAVDLDKPSNGIAFVLEVQRAAGLSRDEN